MKKVREVKEDKVVRSFVGQKEDLVITWWETESQWSSQQMG